MGRGHCVAIGWNRTTGAWDVDCPGTAVTLRAGAREHDLPLRFELVERRIGIRQRRGALPERIRKRADTLVREQHTLEGSDIVEQLLRRHALQLRMIRQRTERLFLQRRHPRIHLIATRRVRAARPGVRPVGSGQRHVIDGRNGAPHIHEGLARHRIGGRIDEFDLRRQREDDPDQPVLAEVAEVVGALAVGPEIVRIDRPEQRIVRLRIPQSYELQKPVPRVDAGRRQLEMVGRHVAVGARAPVPRQAVRPAIEERKQASDDGVAGFTTAVGGRLQRPDAGLRRWSDVRERGAAGGDRQRGKDDETAGDQQSSWFHGVLLGLSGRRQPRRTALER